MLRGLISCEVCGKRYVGTGGQRYYRYVCNGRHRDRRPPGEKECSNANLRGPWIDEVVWTDVEQWLRRPDDVLADLVSESSLSATGAIAEAERTTLAAALQSLDTRRQRAVALYTRESITDSEFDALTAEIASERKSVEERLRSLDQECTDTRQIPDDAIELLKQIITRLDAGLDDAMRREIASLLVHRISVHRPAFDQPAKVLIEYRFPRVAVTSTDTGSSPSLA